MSTAYITLKDGVTHIVPKARFFCNREGERGKFFRIAALDDKTLFLCQVEDLHCMRVDDE